MRTFLIVTALSLALATPVFAAKKAKGEAKKSASAKVEKLKVTDLIAGKGTAAKDGDKLTVHYTGWLLDGKKFDSSKDSGSPFSFTLGGHQVIQGWDQGMVGMKVGGKRELLIPSNMAYGERGAGGVIPPNSPLKFEVELLKIE